jgi:hypothetical protein
LPTRRAGRCWRDGNGKIEADGTIDVDGLRTETNATSPNLIGGFSGNSVTGGVVGATIGGGGQSAFFNQAGANYATVGGGRNNTASGGDSTVGGGLSNTSSAFKATVGGGQSNTASAGNSTVGGGNTNTASGSESTVSGGNGNTASGGNATVGGGEGNTAGDSSATVGGGINNTASGFDSTVGGGGGNTASSFFSTVGGGGANTASGQRSTVGGGEVNTASGTHSTVPGGHVNVAAGAYSFAAGRRAKANHDGTFVWGDSTNANVASTAANEFTIRASGGFRMVVGATPDEVFSIDNNGKIQADGGLQVDQAVVSGVNSVTFSATPVFDASLGNTQEIFLTGNVTSSTLTNTTLGQSINFVICQDGTGGRTFTWPSNVGGEMTISSSAFTCSAQSFVVSNISGFVQATSPGVGDLPIT